MKPTARDPRKYGWIPDLPDGRDYALLRPIRHAVPLPPVVSHRPRMPPVYDQLETGSCTGNASAAAVDFNEQKEGRPFIGPSRLFPYFNARLLEGTTASDAGAQVRDVIKGLAAWGVCTEAEWPYDEKKALTRPDPACYDSARRNLVTSYLAVGGDAGPSVDDIRATLAGGEPIVFGFSVYDSFESDAVAGTGLMPAPNLSVEKMRGGHCVLAVGYDDHRRLLECRNSWSADWGDGGYFWMPYSFAGSSMCDDWWTIRNVT